MIRSETTPGSQAVEDDANKRAKKRLGTMPYTERKGKKGVKVNGKILE